MSNPYVSIIIPVKNAEKTVKKCLESLMLLDYKDFEITIVNDGSTDRTQEIISQYDAIKTINTKGIGPSNCRNIAIRQARGDYIAFTDADCVVDKHWLSELIKSFFDHKVISVGGIQKSPSDDTRFGKKVHSFITKTDFITDYGRNINETKEVNHNPACNAMYRKEAFTDRGFKEDFWPCEDLELDYRLKRAGYKIMYNPKAIVYHYRPESLKKFIKMIFRYGLNSGYLFRRYGVFRALQFEPFILIILIALATFLAKVFLFQLAFILLLGLFLVFFSSTSILAILSLLSWNLGFFLGIFR